MLTYLPNNLSPRPALLVVLHGSMQSAANYDRGAGWSTLADRYGFALLMPEQSGRNNLNRSFNWFQRNDTQRGEGEAHSIVQMVEQIVRDHDIDRRRIFVTGLSAGGAMTLARISHRFKRIGAPNQRKLFCENDFVMIRGEPRCRQSVSRIFLDLKPSKAARWWRRLTAVRSHRMRGRCCLVQRTGRSGWWIGWHRALSIGDPRPMSSILSRRWSGSGYSPSRSATRTSTTMRRCATIH